MSPRAGLDLNVIIMQAAELADSEGLESVTLASLAKKLGVRSPSLYNHVEGLPALRSHLAVYGLQLLNEALSHAAGDAIGYEAVVRIASAYTGFARAHPGLYELTLRAPSLDNKEHERLADKLVNMFLNILSPYGLSEEEGIHAVRGLRSLLHGFASIEGHGGFGIPIDIDKSVAFVLHRFLAGLEKKKGS
ncbi:TetR/AcrR family transcriptional regulator [Paenibacillus nanensis]|uniref:TetR/AcrR family transcriptional regulator n=1 Tax=Paenibacillus nanensis TaxID=393251 RepID=A0A3A1V036_9BACL|nr:TetR/AcrR family transcriptional regulator [Paenibacillus nanensis]RIX53071.1 TetR/AcrR family transcriptional regulator [Paenibacillus nanensis]